MVSKPPPATAGSSSSVRITGSGGRAGPSCACPPAPGCVSAASAADPRDVAAAIAREMLAPPPLSNLPDGTMLAVAPVPGKIPEEWQPCGAWPFWIAWPYAAGACHAEEMTAGQLRDYLTTRDSHG